MADKRLIQRGKQLAFLLRHDKSYSFDHHGWREVSDLMTNHGYTMEELTEIVATNNKQRYEFSEDKSRIRARQGHSVHVDVELEEIIPPDILYHGTAMSYLESIMEKGIVRGNRLYVHLSGTEETAINVGRRHGEPVVLVIDAKRMVKDDHHFFLSRNGVWLTDYVDQKYITNILKMEDYFATTKNGHQLVDNYDPDSNTLDIRSNGAYPSGVLSNLCSNGFRFEGMVCGSMEGFLQSLKQKDRDKQRQICSMKGGNARKHSVTSWQTDQIVWWKGQAYDRQSDEYQKLIRRAYQAMFDQSERFRAALMQTRGITLVHSSGEENPYKTILTEQEFCQILTDIRDNYDKRDKNLESLNSYTGLKNLSCVVFSHGKESGPLGSKIQRLMAVAEELGVKATSIDYRECASADERVTLLHEHLNKCDIPLSQVVLVGSSMGGYVSMVVANELPVAGIFLMAPALWMPAEEYTVQSYTPKTQHIEITHGMFDETVPYENSIRFVKEHNGTILHLVPDDHRLKASHDFLACQFQRFLEELSKPE